MNNVQKIALSLLLLSPYTMQAGPKKYAAAALAATSMYIKHTADTTQDLTKCPTFLQQCPLKPLDKWTKTYDNTKTSLLKMTGKYEAPEVVMEDGEPGLDITTFIKNAEKDTASSVRPEIDTPHYGMDEDTRNQNGDKDTPEA